MNYKPQFDASSRHVRSSVGAEPLQRVMKSISPSAEVPRWSSCSKNIWGSELAGDLDTTMETMSDDPHLKRVASKTLFGAPLGPYRGLCPPQPL